MPFKPVIRDLDDDERRERLAEHHGKEDDET
jgi:hypothetical protein